MKFIIEHLDPEVWNWSLVEYRHITSFAGAENCIFTNVGKGTERLEGLGEAYSESIKEIHTELCAGKKVCVLDPKAEKTLSSDDDFDMLVLGGVLGNHPMDGRTEKEVTSQLPFEARNLGDKQMSTNTAAYVSWKISKGMSFEEFEFVEELIIQVEEGEEIILPFRYVIEDGKVVMPDDYEEMVKKEFF